MKLRFHEKIGLHRKRYLAKSSEDRLWDISFNGYDWRLIEVRPATRQPGIRQRERMVARAAELETLKKLARKFEEDPDALARAAADLERNAKANQSPGPAALKKMFF